MLAMTIESEIILVVVFVLFAGCGVYYALWKAWKKIDALEERVEKLEKRVVPGSYLDVNEDQAREKE